MEPDGAHLLQARTENIQVDGADMDMRRTDLQRMKTALYSPYQYFAAGEKLGEIGQGREHQEERGI